MKLARPAMAAVVVTVLALGAIPAPAQPGQPLDTLLAALERVRTVRETSVSPDGQWVAWVQPVRTVEGENRSAVRLVRRESGPARSITAALDARPRRERGVTFSPDSRSLAFLSDAVKPGQPQLYVVPTAGGVPPRRLTSVVGQLESPRWSPDGRFIAVLFTEGSTQESGALVAYKPDAGVVGETSEARRLAVVDVKTGAVQSLGPASLYVYDYDWSPDGNQLVAEAVEGSGTNDYWIARLYLLDVTSGSTRMLWKPPLQLAFPRFSPDGKQVAVIHGLMSDEGQNGGDVYLVSTETGEAVNATPNLPASASALAWGTTGEVVFAAHRDGGDAILNVRPGAPVATLWSGAFSLSAFNLARDGRTFSLVSQSFVSPPEVWVGEVGHWKPLSDLNATIAPAWGEPKSLHWDSGGTSVQGWLIPPKQVEAARRYPLVVSVHGGPSAQAGAAWPSRWNAVLPAQGYYVFQPNPRGSFGHGAAFTQANVKDFGYGDLQDILKGVDAVLASGAPIDPERVGLIGWSYGGFMTMWAVTQTDRFRAAVAGAGIANWQSYYGQNRIDRWMIPFFGASVYDDPAVYARSSPIAFIKNARTPTLVLHGERDSEVPTPQGYEFWHALKTLGVPTRLVVYPNEGHAISRTEHQRDLQRRVLEWFERYLAPR
jgi:dipeptidyl aminopeptidase/acylaminoacyl peptidase